MIERANRFKLALALVQDLFLVLFTSNRSCRKTGEYMIEVNRKNRKKKRLNV